MSKTPKKESKFRCQVAIIGSQRNRVAKVVQLLGNEKTYPATGEIQDHSLLVDIDYLPCVAKFDSYENEETNETIRYLASVEYYGMDGEQKRGSSLAPFFDEQVDANDESDDGERINLGIIAVAIGSGIENVEDVEKINSLIRLLNGGKKETLESKNDILRTALDMNLPIIEVITPGPKFSSMKEEMEAYRILSADEKHEVTEKRTLGPGRMAAFTKDLLEKNLAILLGLGDDKELKKIDVENIEAKKTEEILSPPSITPYEIAVEYLSPEKLASKIHFSCRKCRTPLFTEDDLENPPHPVGKHTFNRKKIIQFSGACQSAFLNEGLPWMGDITLEMEGKITCPRPSCNAKVGSWNWSGAQCSCGTWVTPAIQFPLSKVDKVQPRNMNINVIGSYPTMMVNPVTLMNQR